MALKTLEGLPDEVAKLYKQGDDGEYHLETEGVHSALRKERERANAAEKALKEREKAEEDAKRKAEEEQALKRGEFDKIRAQDQETIKKLQDEAQGLQTRLRNSARDKAAMEAITAAGGIPKALMPHIIDSLEVVPEGDNFKVVVKADPGKKLGDFVAGLKSEMPWGFNAPGASGAGTAAGGGTGGAQKPWKEMTLTEQTNLYRTNPTQAKALQEGA